MSNEDTRDLTDQILGIDSVELAIVAIPTQEGRRLSFRSKKPIEVLSIAKKFGGGGHKYASGAFVSREHPLYPELKKHLFSMVEDSL
jgi:phosphoesterase RecJ-like protein